MLCSSLIKPIAQQELLTKKEIEYMFSNVEAVLEVNKKLLEQFNRVTIVTSQITCIGQIFLDTAKSLEVYELYCSNQERSRICYAKCIKNNKFKKYCDNILLKPEFRLLGLESFLIKPIQRITKYPLLLKVNRFRKWNF